MFLFARNRRVVSLAAVWLMLAGCGDDTSGHPRAKGQCSNIQSEDCQNDENQVSGDWDYGQQQDTGKPPATSGASTSGTGGAEPSVGGGSGGEGGN